METFIEIIKAIFFGIVQGITEWLPISSTGHLILLNEFFAMDKTFFDNFKVLIQLGSILAVIVLFFHKLNPFSGKKTAEEKKSTWHMWFKVAIASIPTAIVGFAFEDIVDEKLGSPFVIAAALIIYGIAFIVIENKKKEPQIKEISQLSYKTAFFIGLFQMLALIPGTSRSGSTIIGATLLGASRVISAEFSFFMAIPVMFGASGYKLLKLFKGISNETVSVSGTQWLVLVIGFVVAFVVSLVVISKLMDYIKKKDFKPFGYYRIILGIIVIVYFGVKAFVR